MAYRQSRFASKMCSAPHEQRTRRFALCLVRSLRLSSLVLCPTSERKRHLSRVAVHLRTFHGAYNRPSKLVRGCLPQALARRGETYARPRRSKEEGLGEAGGIGRHHDGLFLLCSDSCKPDSAETIGSLRGTKCARHRNILPRTLSDARRRTVASQQERSRAPKAQHVREADLRPDHRGGDHDGLGDRAVLSYATHDHATRKPVPSGTGGTWKPSEVTRSSAALQFQTKNGPTDREGAPESPRAPPRSCAWEQLNLP